MGYPTYNQSPAQQPAQGYPSGAVDASELQPVPAAFMQPQSVTISKTPVDPYAVSDYWGTPNQPFQLQVGPQLCLVKKLQIADIIRAGLLGQLDTFSSALVAEPGEESEDDQSANALMKRLADPEAFANLETMLDKIIFMSVLRPQIHPKPSGDRKTGLAYVDQIGFSDKMFIFNNVFQGLGDLSSFREE